MQRHSLYAYPAGAYFCVYKSRQNTLGAVPQGPLTLKLRLDTNDAKHRPYSAADTFSRRLRRILFGFCRPIAESYAAKTMGRTSNYLDRRPLPRHGGGERGCEAERRQWRMQRGGAPAAVEKNEQASSAKFFSGTARRRGQIRRGYLWSASVRSTDLFFPIIEGKTIFVSSTAKRQRGLQRGKLGSPLPCFASFCRSKRKAPAASGVNYAFAKGSTPPIGDHKLSPPGRRAH